jgi:hypothetical protein
MGRDPGVRPAVYAVRLWSVTVDLYRLRPVDAAVPGGAVGERGHGCRRSKFAHKEMQFPAFGTHLKRAHSGNLSQRLLWLAEGRRFGLEGKQPESERAK